MNRTDNLLKISLVFLLLQACSGGGTNPNPQNTTAVPDAASANSIDARETFAQQHNFHDTAKNINQDSFYRRIS